MNKEKIEQYNKFRKICLQNAEDFILTAESLLGKNINHIAYHLGTLCLEEIGKIFLVYYQISHQGQENGEINMATDDHVKKLFWAIWGPTFGNETITKDQLDERKNMASNIHNKRLFALYSEISDSKTSKEKIENEECKSYLKYVRARFELEKSQGDLAENESKESIEILRWFINSTDDPLRRKFIFGSTAQNKLIELQGSVHDWIKWLKETSEKEEEELRNLAIQEINKPLPSGEEPKKQKWKVKIKIITPSHSIRTNILNEFNKEFKQNGSVIQLYKGVDNHVLILEMIFDNCLSVNALWNHGWMVSKIFITSLNVGAQGLFWWNTTVDLDKYYDEIVDLENKRKLDLKASPKIELNWREYKLVLDKERLNFTALIFGYFVRVNRTDLFSPVTDYMTGLALIAKNDIHLRLEVHAFNQFYCSFKKALTLNAAFNEEKDNIKDIGFKAISVLPSREEFDRIMDLGINLQVNTPVPHNPISLTEVIAIKNYCDLYFAKLAALEMCKGKEVKLEVAKLVKPSESI